MPLKSKPADLSCFLQAFVADATRAPDRTGYALNMEWPEARDFVHGEVLPSPETWNKPGLVMFFHLECAGCVSRGIPFMKELHREHGDRLNLLAIHTARGHRILPRDQVEASVQHFARSFARLPFAVALDLDGSLALHHHTEGTPHWLVFDGQGQLVRSIYGSQDNARTRLVYLLEELLTPSEP